MEKLLKVIGAFLIYLAFLPACMLVWLSIPYYLVTFRPKQTVWAVNAMNRMVSTLFGGDGTRNTSTHCGLQIINGEVSWKCSLLCKILSYFDPDHCRKEAE